MSKFSKLVKVSFFVFLDISGILLGVFLTGLGLALILGWSSPGWLNWLIMVIGVGAFFLHVGHYFNLKYMRWLFGDKYFIEK